MRSVALHGDSERNILPVRDSLAIKRSYIAVSRKIIAVFREFLSQRSARDMPPIISVENLTKTYGNGFEALKGIDLDIERGEILALLGPNGAGKTTLISIICGIVNPSGGKVLVGGHNVVKDFRQTRAMIGLVPQELTTDQFETVWNTVSFSRGVFGKKPDPARIEKILRDLSLWTKKDNMLRELSGGMKRRVLIAKALSHEPEVLFLDEPTAGVDVSLRRDMWQVVKTLREEGVTIILTTHYIEEAEEIADRVGVVNGGRLLLLEEKNALMRKFGRKQLTLELAEPLDAVPPSLAAFNLTLAADGRSLVHEYSHEDSQDSMTSLLAALSAAGISFKDLSTRQSSLEDIFVALVEEKA
jgi:ABC-2 type transport system ATP-binding protein